ncbi:MAG: hypothetical protein DDG60_00750 [Anaerolineae bacterium]|nr:MAG: hypothetical protein DDG60_00750 [Anaerolineae bacterium]
MAIDFIRLVENDLHQQARKIGRNYFFKCPFHGGGNEKTASLKVTNGDATHNPGFYCFSCNEHGGAVGYFLKRGYSLEDARRIVGEPAQPYTPRPADEIYELPDNPPGPAWQKRAREFMAYARKQYDTFAQSRESKTEFDMTDRETGEKITQRMVPVEWWLQRGLSVLTGQHWGIGYNPKDWYISRADLGLPVEEGKSKVWLPQGFVIPCQVGADLWYIKIRRPQGNPKYIHIPGSVPALYMAENLVMFKDRSVVFTEGELDALLAWQEVGDLAGVATLGASTNAKRFNVATWGLYLLYPKYRFTVYDLDEAGQKGAEDLARFNFQRLTLPQVMPFDKDITDYHNRTGLFREWFVSELAKYPGALLALTSQESWIW